MSSIMTKSSAKKKKLPRTFETASSSFITTIVVGRNTGAAVFTPCFMRGCQH